MNGKTIHMTPFTTICLLQNLTQCSIDLFPFPTAMRGQAQKGKAAFLQDAVLQPVTFGLAAAGQVGSGSIHLNSQQRLLIHFMI